jgi:hypothetical protein
MPLYEKQDVLAREKTKTRDFLKKGAHEPAGTAQDPVSRPVSYFKNLGRQECNLLPTTGLLHPIDCH